MRTILLVESDSSHLRRLERWIEDGISEDCDIKILVATNYEDGKRWMTKNHIDLPILSDETGLELAKLYRETYKYHTVIFQTTDNDPLFLNRVHDELGSMVCLSKSDLTKDKLISKLYHELERLEQPFIGVHFVKQHNGGRVRIDPQRTLYFEKMSDTHVVKHHYYDLATASVQTDILPATSLNKIDRLLDSGIYLRTHQSFIVNRNKIEGIEINGSSYLIHLQQGMITVPISRRYFKKVAFSLKGHPVNPLED